MFENFKRAEERHEFSSRYGFNFLFIWKYEYICVHIAYIDMG